MRFIERIEAPKRDQFFSIPGYHVWDPSVIRDETRGIWHLYGSRWPAAYGMSGWLTDSRIFRAEGDSPAGPFRFAEELTALTEPAWSRHMNHNPKVMKIKGTYCLYYIGTRWNADGAACRKDRRSWERVWCNKRIGVATAESPAGPWIPCPNNPVLDVRPGHWDCCLTSNPVAFEKDDSVYMIYKSAPQIGSQPFVQQLGLTVADHVCGPYRRTGRSPLFSHNIEDPYVWREGDAYWMLSKDMTGNVCNVRQAGILYRSDDGVNWRLASEPLAYDLMVEWQDGSRQSFQRLERPHLYLEGGASLCLYHAALPGPGALAGILARRLRPW